MNTRVFISWNILFCSNNLPPQLCVVSMVSGTRELYVDALAFRLHQLYFLAPRLSAIFLMQFYDVF